MSERSCENRFSLAELVDRCRERGMRRTQAMESVLKVLLEADCPLTAGEIVESPELKGQCDPATVYRLLLRLEDHGILRKLGLRDRAAHFTVRHAHTHDDYIICTQCGTIEELDMDCPVEALEADIAQRSGFSQLDHELEFFGICPKCTTADVGAS